MCMLLLLCAILANYCTAVYDNYRLPRYIKPQHYNLRVITHLEEVDRLIFTGDVEILFRVYQDTNRITLHAGSELNIAKPGPGLRIIKHQCKERIEIRRVQRYEKYELLILHLENCLQAGQQYLLRIQFWAKLSRSMSGYYASSYWDESDNSLQYLSVTQFEPTDARRAFPCFDEPNLKATFNITLGHHCQYNALSNMPVLERIPICERKDWLWTIFKQTEVMSTYLVAYSVNDFQGFVSQSRDSRIQFTTWARAAVIDQCRYSSVVGPKLIAHFEKMLDVEYPLHKMDLLAVPDFSAGAMENWGLITFREAALFYAQGTSSQADKQRIAIIIAHELSHQWFGNLVTMDWWDDLWLNEGFATYMAALGVEKLCCQWHAYEEEMLDNLLTVLSTDSFCNTRPIHQTVYHAGEVSENFDAITYRKGAVIIRMMHMFVGDVAFRRGIHFYLMKHAYGNAKQEDLWQALTKAAHESDSIPPELDVEAVMNTWTLQKGIPLICVERDYLKKTATVKQQRFLVNNDHVEESPCWFVPISYAIECSANFISTEPRAWLQCSEVHGAEELQLHDLPGDQEWLILNVQVTTPYRVKYDTENWELIIRALLCTEYHRIHVMNRAQLLDDSLALAWSGHMSYELTLNLLGYLKQEPEYLPWRAALTQLNSIYRIIRYTKDFDEFQHFMHHLLSRIYCQLEGMKADEDHAHHAAHKTLITKWACALCFEDCVERALNYFHRWLICSNPDESNPVPVNLRSVVYCTAMEHGDEEDWNFLWHRFRNSSVASEKRVLLLALACTRKVCLLQRYLRIIYHHKSFIRKQDASLIFGAIVRNKAGLEVAKNFFFQKFLYLKKYYFSNARELIGLLSLLGQHISCPHGYRQVRSFILSHEVVLQQTSRRSLMRILEEIRFNLRWRHRKLPEFARQLATINSD